METVKKFYSVAGVNKNVQQKLAELSLTADDITQGDAYIADLETSRTLYLQHSAESQIATQSKNRSFARIDAWMQDFYDVARLALSDRPQSLEALGIIVKAS